MERGKVRICLIGCGYWGANLARNLATGARTELAALCDSNPKSLEQFSARFPRAKIYRDLDAALADPSLDAVALATPSSLHHRHGLQALAAGKHVFVEKPIASSVQEAMELVAAADRADRRLMVGHTFLYNNLVHEVKKHIVAGELGKVFYGYSQRLNLGLFRRDSDVLWTLAPHDVSIFNYLFDARPVRVSARGQCFVHRQTGVAEVCFADMEYPDGRSAHMHLSWLDPQKKREMVFVGSERMLIYDDANPDAHLRIYDKKAEVEYLSPATDFSQFRTKLRAGDVVTPKLKLAEPLSAELDHFAGCVLDGKTPDTDGRHGAVVTAVLEAMTNSMSRDGAVIDVAYPDQLSDPAAAVLAR